jgi:hypothetical protein
MDSQDHALLDKQLRSLHIPPRRDGLLVATTLAVFLGGIIVGAVLIKTQPAAPTPATLPAVALLNGAPAPQ